MDRLQGFIAGDRLDFTVAAPGFGHRRRAKVLTLKPAHWDLLERSNPRASAEQIIHDRIGAGHDDRGLILSQVRALDRHGADRCFCSEICGAALGLPNPQRLPPQMVFDVVTRNEDRMIWR